MGIDINRVWDLIHRENDSMIFLNMIYKFLKIKIGDMGRL